jgi:hypothetical protein
MIVKNLFLSLSLSPSSLCLVIFSADKYLFVVTFKFSMRSTVDSVERQEIGGQVAFHWQWRMEKISKWRLYMKIRILFAEFQVPSKNGSVRSFFSDVRIIALSCGPNYSWNWQPLRSIIYNFLANCRQNAFCVCRRMRLGLYTFRINTVI